MKVCIHRNPKTHRCKILSYNKCPENCTSKITDPEIYIQRLNDMITYNSDNPNACAKLQKEIKQLIKQYQLPERPKESGPMSGLFQVYLDEINRGTPGSHSEGNTNNQAIKQKMKDNRPVGTKPNAVERQEIHQATKEWEEEHGKLERLGRSLMSRSKVDSYTGDEIK